MDCTEETSKQTFKRCPTCKHWKPRTLEFYNRDACRSDGLKSMCKTCSNKRKANHSKRTRGYLNEDYHELKSGIYDELIEKFGGKSDVRIWSGFIDVLTPKYIFEVKRLHNWKHALGQLLVYKLTFPGKTPVAILYAPQESDLFLKIQRIFSSYGVQVYQRVGSLSANTKFSGCT